MNSAKYLLTILLLFCFSCSSESGNPSHQPQDDASAKEQSKPKGSYIKFKPVSLIDREGTGGECLSMLIPEGWEMQGQVYWQLDNPGYPATGQLTVKQPSQDLQFEYFPLLSYYYTTDQLTMMNFPPGSKYMGHVVVTEVPGVIEGLKRYLLPQFRNNVKNLHIVESKILMPEKRESLGANMYSISEGAVIRIEYTENGQAYEENIYGVRSINSSAGASFADWYLTNCYGFKAPKGKLEDQLKLFQTMLYSIALNKQWFNHYAQVSNMLINQGYQNIAAAGQISRILSQTNDEISQMISETYWNAQQSQARVYEKFSDYIRGVDTYVDPASKESYKLPSGYTNAWKNDLGEYMVSDVAGFDPGQLSNQNWTELQLKH